MENLEETILEVLRERDELTRGRITKIIEHKTGERVGYTDLVAALDSLEQQGLIKVRSRKHHTSTYRLSK